MGIWRFTCFSLLLGFFQSSFSEITGDAELNVAVEEGTSIHINTSAGINTQCEVCISQVCQSSVILRNDTSLNFSCSEPENVFTVQIITDIELPFKMKSIIEPKEYHVFQKFSRTFTWNLNSPTKTTYFNFSRTGLRQIHPTDSCPDKHVYMITSKDVSVGRFCQNGTITEIQVRNVGKLSLEVSGGQPLDLKDISVSLGFVIYGSLAAIKVVLPEMSSTQDFFTPNTFPENAVLTWRFKVPHAYYIDVHIMNYTVPTCIQPENIPKIKYIRYSKKDLVKPLDVTQPLAETGDIALIIKNCNMSKTDPPSEGLMVHFQISSIKRKTGQCKRKLPENEMLQIRVMKKDPKSLCVLKLDSDVMDTVTIASGDYYDIEFFDCNKDELEFTVNQTRECKEWRNCAYLTFPITFNYEQNCIPGVLKMITWHLHGPQNSSVELQSPTGLRYCLPEDECNSNLLLNVSHDNPDITVGQFCPSGTIEKIQIRESKIAVTASVTSFNDQNLATELFLTYSFTQDISEDYIFTVAPKLDNPTVLATPAWPSGMKPSSNVSWIINMEPQLKSNLKFMNVSQPECMEVQTNIVAQTILPQMIVYSAKTEENINDVLVPESFYLNMTNCKSPTGSFRAMMEITLQNNTKNHLGIILSIVGIVLMIITAVVIWIFLRKKKKNKTPPVSNYNPNAFLPGLHGIPKTQEEEDPHSYVYIDDTLVYSHLLDKEAENEQCKDESGPPLPDRPVGKGESLVTKGSGMVDNELYGYFQGQSTTSGSPKSPIKTSEDEACETRLCEREESP
ncbi:CUB domain-containing protein 1-like [Megalobrama amblycephala]|uniref:CUB domain-containing protein 1-like n=1 Tax=Megalobrama amblycephala TaxID=75352 RepID=UPI0020143838|nr:CUB domain-containing protein 1-like [Megalobrama amblycephala]